MRRLPYGAGLLACAALLTLGGCVSEQREQTIGDQVAAQINSQVPLVTDVPLNLYVNDLGRMIASKSARPGLRYHFYIVDTPGLNAFALPGGHIYVNRGLIERTRDVSELAGVLAHEIGHVAARHGAQNLQRQMRSQGMASTMYHLILGREPLLDQDALALGGAMWNAQHSRADEAEADRLAVKYLVASGVDPRGMLSLFSTLMAEERHDPQALRAEASWFSTHPATAARMDATRAQIRNVLAAPHRQLTRENASYPAFMRRLDELPQPLLLPLPPGHPGFPDGPGPVRHPLQPAAAAKK
ncbi:MAG TPA: M48 family metallopeptidase [Longimicrobium sp.]|jgi:predicted Zn-dependent protease|uniref:M48 family metallopeptidase n=1 Tax=Longimicrobium sp. TaxID=2029185 RepID=UPI002ED802AD